jgi:hypothetical protein
VTDLGPTPFQARVLYVPEPYDVALLGGRGGGKSRAIAFLILRHCEARGELGRCLYVRRTHAALEDFALGLRQLFGAAYGSRARFNAAEGIWKLPGGGYVELSQLADDGHYAKFQGRSFSLIAVDEATQYASPRLLDMLRSNLRGEQGVPTRFVLAGNPGDVGMGWMSRRHVRTGVAPWQPYTEADTGRSFATCPSTFLDNPHVDQTEYRRQLEAACSTDPELLRAWIEGDWSVSRGSYFGDVVSESRNLFGPWNPNTWQGRPPAWAHRFAGYAARHASAAWTTYLAHDYGSSAPSITYVVTRSPGAHGPDGRFYPRGSILLLDELATFDPSDPTRGLGWTIPQLAEAIVELAARWGLASRWGVAAQGVADDACFAKTGHVGGSIAEEFRRERVYFRPARKGARVAGWQRMRTLLAAAGKPDVPGLYVSRTCRYWWETVPLLVRDPRRLEDVDTRGPDHAADACRYALVYEEPRATVADLLL